MIWTEDWRGGKPAMLTEVEAQLKRWITSAQGRERKIREERVTAAFVEFARAELGEMASAGPSS